MQALFQKFLFSKNCIFTLWHFLYQTSPKFSLLLTSHNCIIITMFSFQGANSSKSKSQLTHLMQALNARLCLCLSSVHSNPLHWALNGNLSLKKLNEASLSRNFSQFLFVVEISGIEPLTSCLQGRRSPSWAKPPYLWSGGPKWTRTIDLTIISRVL